MTIVTIHMFGILHCHTYKPLSVMQETCQGHFESPVLSNSLSTFVKEERHNPRTSSCHEKCAMVEFGLRQRQLEPISQKVVPRSEGGELNYHSPKEQTGFISVKITARNQARFGGFPSLSPKMCFSNRENFTLYTLSDSEIA